MENNLQLQAHNGSGFDTWIKLNNFPCDKQFVDFLKIGKGVIPLRVLKAYIQICIKQVPQYQIFRCGVTHLNYSSKKLGNYSN